MIRRDHATGLYAAHCDGALSCNARSKPSPRNWAVSTAKRAGWNVMPGLFPGDSKPANMGVTICPVCVERMKLGTLHSVDTGSDDRPPPRKAKTLAPHNIMPDLCRKILKTIREREQR